MSTDAIKDAIVALTLEDRHTRASWLNDLDYDAWDKQMVTDFSPGGRGMALIEKVRREIAEGESAPLQERQASAESQPQRSRE